MAALQARHVLEGQEVDGHVVDVGWLKEGTHTLNDLHSKVSRKIKSELKRIQFNWLVLYLDILYFKVFFAFDKVAL